MPTSGTSSRPDWAVELASMPSGGDVLYPGAGVESVPFTVVNDSSRPEKLSEIDASVAQEASAGDAATQRGLAIPGCLARWFRVAPAHSNAALPPRPIAPGAVYRGVVLVTMLNAPVNQDACRGAQPALHLSVS